MITTLKLELNAKAKADGTSGILIRLTQNRRHKRTSTGIFIRKADFNKKAKHGSWIRSSNPSHEQLNKKLKDKLSQAEKSLSEVEKEIKNPSLNVIRTHIKGYSRNFIEFADQKITMLLDAGNIATYKKTKSIIGKLTDYVGSKELPFDDLTVSFLKNYEHHLKVKGNKINTIHSNLKTIKALIHEAIEEGIFTQEKNPFFIYKLKTEIGSKERLTIDEIKKLEKLRLSKGSFLNECRNYFLFSFYCAGIRASDLMQLKWKNVIDGRLEYQMNKTGSPVSFRLYPKSLKILKGYKKSKLQHEDYIFPIINAEVDPENKLKFYNEISRMNALINKYLKTLAKKAGIKKNLSLHVSRHSFASIAKQKGVELQKISELLAHSNKKVTEDYLRSFTSTVLDSTLEGIVND